MYDLYDDDEIQQEAAGRGKVRGLRSAVCGPRNPESENPQLETRNPQPPSDPGREIAEHVRMILAERDREPGEPGEPGEAHDDAESLERVQSRRIQKTADCGPRTVDLPPCPTMSQPTQQNPTEPNGIQHPLAADPTESNGTQQSDPTISNETQRNPTVSENEIDPESYFGRISTRKQAAIRHLIEGASITETARRIGVCRWTVSRWINHDFEFERALREKLREVWGESALGMAAHARKAVNKLAALLDSNHIPYRYRSAVRSPRSAVFRCRIPTTLDRGPWTLNPYRYRSAVRSPRSAVFRCRIPTTLDRGPWTLDPQP